MQDTSFSEHQPTVPVTAAGTSLGGKLARVWPVAQWRGVHVLLAVSGGADSVALLRTMVVLKQQTGGAGQLHVAHLHHGLRGEEADADQAWVTELCQAWDLPLWTGRAEITPREAREGWEAAARQARYDFLLKTAEQIGARYVATAHTADDQVETILHRVLRGTGIQGLIGIPAFRSLSPSVMLVRPVLNVSRAEVLAYLSELQQDFRIDSTNASTRFTRNLLRHELLPAIREQVNPDVDGALLRLSQQAVELQTWLIEYTDRLAAKYVEVTQDAVNGESGKIRIACSPLAGEPSLVVRELCKRAWQQAGWPLRDMGYDQWQQLAELVSSADESAMTLPGAVRAQMNGQTLVLSRSRLPGGTC